MRQRLPESLVAPVGEHGEVAPSPSPSPSPPILPPDLVPYSSPTRPHVLLADHHTYSSSLGIANIQPWKERSKYIPLRLTASEQKDLLLMDCALSVSEYTDKVDISTITASQRGITKNLTELLSITAGLSVASNYKLIDTLKDKKFGNYPEFFQRMFESMQLFFFFA